MATLATLTAAISTIIQDSSITDITDRINDCVQMISAGVRLPDGRVSPPLPELFQTDTITTDVSLAYVSLPATYQRNVFFVADASGDKINPPKGGDLYSFMLFLKQIYKKDLTEAGSVYAVSIKGNRLYYQGIPSTPKDLTLHFYRKPALLVDSTDVPEGIPSHLQRQLIVNFVCADIFGSMIEDGETSNKMASTYHLNEYYKSLISLVDFIGEDDSEPIFYKSGNEGITDFGAVY